EFIDEEPFGFVQKTFEKAPAFQRADVPTALDQISHLFGRSNEVAQFDLRSRSRQSNPASFSRHSLKISEFRKAKHGLLQMVQRNAVGQSNLFGFDAS